MIGGYAGYVAGCEIGRWIMSRRLILLKVLLLLHYTVLFFAVAYILGIISLAFVMEDNIADANNLLFYIMLTLPLLAGIGGNYCSFMFNGSTSTQFLKTFGFIGLVLSIVYVYFDILQLL